MEKEIYENAGLQCLFTTHAWTSGVYFDTCAPFLKGKINQQKQSLQTEPAQRAINQFLSKTVFNFENFKCL